MSELSNAFEKAILTFTHAGDFVVSLFEGGYMIAEDISDKIAEKRELARAPIEERFAIENQIAGAVAFFPKLLPAFLVIQIALLEDCLLEICETAAQKEKVEFDPGSSSRFTAVHAVQFFKERLGVRFPKPWAAWERLLEIQELRDDCVNSTALSMWPAGNGDSYLVEINKAILSFLDELRSYLPDIEE